MEERNCPMEDPFAFLTLNFLKKSEIFPGSLGTFRYRFQRTGKVNDGTVQAWVYENICFEKGPRCRACNRGTRISVRRLT